MGAADDCTGRKKEKFYKNGEPHANSAPRVFAEAVIDNYPPSEIISIFLWLLGSYFAERRASRRSAE